MISWYQCSEITRRNAILYDQAVLSIYLYMTNWILSLRLWHVYVIFVVWVSICFLPFLLWYFEMYISLFKRLRVVMALALRNTFSLQRNLLSYFSLINSPVAPLITMWNDRSRKYTQRPLYIELPLSRSIVLARIDLTSVCVSGWVTIHNIGLPPS